MSEHATTASTPVERADGSTPIRRAIGEVLRAAALHMIASPECAQAVDRVVALHLASRREVGARETQQSLCVHWLDQMFNFCPWCGIARAALAATQEPREEIGGGPLPRAC